MAAGGVEQAVHPVGGADVDVDHDRLRFAGDEIITDGHVHGGIFVGTGYRRRYPGLQHLRLCQRFDHRREIGSGVGEPVIDAAIGEQRQVGVGDGNVVQRNLCHELKPLSRNPANSYGRWWSICKSFF